MQSIYFKIKEKKYLREIVTKPFRINLRIMLAIKINSQSLNEYQKGSVYQTNIGNIILTTHYHNLIRT